MERSAGGIRRNMVDVKKVGGALFVSLLAVVAACLAATILESRGAGRIEAASPGEPILVVQDEATPAVYVLWPGKKCVEAFHSDTDQFVTYDFSSLTVTRRPAKIIGGE
jgi:hypothetical protein